MNSPTRTTTQTPSRSLPAELQQIGLRAVATDMDDFLARATKQRWSPRQILEHLTQTEAAERAHRSLERPSQPTIPNPWTGNTIIRVLRL